MIVAHEIQQLGLGGTEKTMLLFLRHLRALGVEQLHAFSPRWRETDRAGQVAEVAELHLYEDLDGLARELRALRPHVLHRHRSGYADPLDQAELDPRTRIVETNVYGDHGSRADLRLFVSQTVAREQDWSGPVDVLYNPCETPFSDSAVARPYRRFPGVAERDVEKVVVFGRVGRPSAHIYDPIALEAYAQVESPWTRYVALAPPPNMVDHAQWLGLKTFLALPPTMDERELSRFYSLIDVLAHARRDGETCGMNIQEAMIHGLPVITHLSDTHNAQPEILGEGYPWIAPKGDRDAYTRFMREALESPARRAVLGQRNRERAVEEFDARRITERLLGHYERLCGWRGGVEAGTGGDPGREGRTESGGLSISLDLLRGLTPEVIAERVDLTRLDQAARQFLPQQHVAYLNEAPGREHYRLLAHLSSLVPGAPIADVGTLHGSSALALSYGSGPVSSYDMERVHRFPERWGSIDFLQGNVLVPGPAHEHFRRVVARAPLILLDVDPHDGEQEQRFLALLGELRFRGCLVLDDIHLNPRMERVWSSIERPKVDLTSCGHSTGTGCVLFSEDP